MESLSAFCPDSSFHVLISVAMTSLWEYTKLDNTILK